MPYVGDIRELDSPSRPQLLVNDGPLADDQVAFLKPTTLDTPMDEVRARFAEDGYVFMKGLLPRADVLRAREAYFRLLEPTGVLAPGTQPVEGIFDSAKDAHNYPGIGANSRELSPDPALAERFIALAVAAHSAPWYKDDFCKHPALRAFIADMQGWGDRTLGFTRTLLRNNTPGNKAIGVHYDQIFLRHGEDTSVTAWIPMGDVALTGGGLIYLERGHTLGADLEAAFTAKAAAAGMDAAQARSAFNAHMAAGGVLDDGPAGFAAAHGRRWLVAEYEAGDVVLHSPYAVHASTVNTDPNKVIRLGTDVRFVDGGRPWDERWAHVYRLDDGV